MNAPLIAAACAFVAVVAFVLLVVHVTSRRGATVRRRLDHHAIAVDVAEAQRVERHEIFRNERFSAIPLLNAILVRLRPARTAVVELKRAGMSLGVVPYLGLRLLLGLGLVMGVHLLLGDWLLALPLLPVGLMLPRFLVRRRAVKRRTALEAQWAEALDLFVGSLRAGLGFLQGLESISREMADPMRDEIGQVLDQVAVGTSPVDALQEMTERVPSYDLALMVAAISVQRQTGGNLAEVLENLAATVRERRRVRGEVRALTTGPRVSSYVLAAIPSLLFVYFLGISKDYRHVMLGTTYGHVLLALAAVLSLLGYLFASKVAKVEY
jgi:tight adherence protein B